MGTRAKVLTALALVGAGAVLFLPGDASAATPSGVTIHHYFSDTFKGYVFSPKPGQCADGRRVTVFRQTGKKQHPNRDVKVAETHAAKRGSGKYLWEASADRPGDYYAQVAATSACQGDNSKTVTIRKRPDTRILEVEVANHHVSFDYYAVGGATPYHFRCKLDHHQYRRCPRNGRVTFKGLRRGRHVFKIRAVGHDGKGDPTPAKHRFHISRR